MSSDLNPELRAELVKAQAVLEPELRGLHDLAATSISDELRAEINKAISARDARKADLDAALAALDALNAAMDILVDSGYPALPDATLQPGLFTELQGEESDLDAAVSIFEESGPATTLEVDLGMLVEKPPEG